MKNKNLAALMAFFLGPIGVHRFYLGDIGKGIGMFILWRILGWKIAMVVGIIDAVVFLSMSQEEFDEKYNEGKKTNQYNRKERHSRSARNTRRERPDFNRKDADRRRYDNERERSRKRNAVRREQTEVKRTKKMKVSPFKKNGIEKFKDYDYQGAISDFQKVLEVNPNDTAVHFNIACAYSLTEKAEKAFEHLDKAVGSGFKDFERIRTHDAFAFLRVQDEFDEFAANRFQLRTEVDAPDKEFLESKNPDLLEQLNKLNDLKNKGLLTDGEFATQKKKLLAE